MRLLAGILAAAVIVAASPARAQGGASLKMQVSHRQAEVGQNFTLQLTAMVESGDQRRRD